MFCWRGSMVAFVAREGAGYGVELGGVVGVVWVGDYAVVAG